MNLPSAVVEQANNVEQFYEQEQEEGGDQLSIPSPDEDKVEEQPPQQPTTEETYEKRFKSFKQKTDITIHEQRVKLQELERAAAENEVLRQQLEHTKRAQPKFSKEALESFSGEELEVFDKMVNQRTSGLISKVQNLEAQLELAKQRDNEERKVANHMSLKARVQDAVPDFQTLDTSPAFRTWLNGLDSYGNLRMEGLKNAQRDKDVARIISFYNDFKQLQEPVKVDPRVLQQVPSGTSTASNNKSAEKQFSRHWDNVAIQQYFKDAALGKYTDSQREELEQEMHAYLNR